MRSPGGVACYSVIFEGGSSLLSAIVDVQLRGAWHAMSIRSRMPCAHHRMHACIRQGEQCESWGNACCIAAYVMCSVGRRCAHACVLEGSKKG